MRMRAFGLVGALVAASTSLACASDSGAAPESGSGSEPSTEPTGEPADPCAGAAMHTGEATYYDFADGSGNCSFPATPDDLRVAAMNHVDYAASAVCGACVHVEGPLGTVDLRVVDQCPECPAGNLDLSPDAFAEIAALEAGRVPITWVYAPCPVEGPVVYHFKDGSNAYWTAVQIRNHRHAIEHFWFQQADQWVEVPRVDYNYFVQDTGMGEGPLRFRIADVLGNTLEDADIPLLDDADAPGAAQFPACD